MDSKNAHSRSPEVAQERREECRRAVRGWLAERPTIAAHPKQILRGLNAGHEHDFADEEIAAALVFLRSSAPPQIERIVEEVGATAYYQINGDGIRAHERDPRA